MESRPSRVRWSELIQAGVWAASQIKVRFSRLARKLCWIRLASRKLGLGDACVSNECVVGRTLSMVNHLRLPIACDLALPRLGKVWKELLHLSTILASRVACYDGTLLPAARNRQCTRTQLGVKRRSTAK